MPDKAPLAAAVKLQGTRGVTTGDCGAIQRGYYNPLHQYY